MRSSLLAVLALTSVLRPAAAQVEPGVARAVDEFVGNTIELSILFSNAPGPGGVMEVRAGKTDVEVSKLKIDPDLPFGVPADTDDLDALDLHERPAPTDPDSPLLRPRWLLVPLVDVRLGMSTADRRASDIVPGGPRSVQVRVDSRSLGLGGGLRLELLPWLHLEHRLVFIYSHLQADTRRGPAEDRIPFEVRFHRTLVDWRAELLTVMPAVDLSAAFELGPLSVWASTSATHLRTLPLSASSRVQERERSSTLLHARLAVDVPIPGFAPWDHQVYVTPSVGGTHVLGDLGRIRGAGREYVDVALGLAPDLRGALPTVGRLGVIFSYLRGQNLEGWAVDVVWIIDL